MRWAGFLIGVGGAIAVDALAWNWNIWRRVFLKFGLLLLTIGIVLVAR